MSARTPDRRHSRRLHRVGDHGVLVARVRPGHRARLIDISAGGALVETTCRLLPGSVVELQVETGAQRTVVRGHVLRCTVVRVRPTWICYRGAIGFDRHLPWFADGEGYGVPTCESREGRAERGDTTQQVL